MPYDLYGNHYISHREAENAELAQMAEINSRYNQQDINRVQQQQHISDHWMSERIAMLEERVSELEKKLQQP